MKKNPKLIVPTYIILLIVVIAICLLFFWFVFNSRNVDIVFSINVHENVKFLIKQLKNIKLYVKSKYIVIINANKKMHEILQNNKYLKNNTNIILYPKYLNKKRFHGSLTQGIYQNMKYAMKFYYFRYFIVLSSRNFFYNKLNPGKYKQLTDYSNPKKINQINIKSNAHWPSFLKTKLSQYIIKNNLKFSRSAHEGLTFNYYSCKDILLFLDKHKDISDNIFNCNSCVEEFALQSICVNHSHPYYNIGNGTKTNDIHKLKENAFVFKKKRI